MENTGQNNTSVAVHQPLNMFHAGLSLVCPGLGQLFQKRFEWGLYLFLFVAFIFFLCFHVYAADGDIHGVPLFSVKLLLAVFFAIVSAWDAATWQPEKSGLFTDHYTLVSPIERVSDSDEYEEAGVAISLFCVVDDHAKLLDLVRANVCDEQWSPTSSRARGLFQFQRFARQTAIFPRK